MSKRVLSNTYSLPEDNSENSQDNDGDEQADPLLLSGATGVDNGDINFLVSSLEMNISLLGVFLDGVHDNSLLSDQSFHVNEQLVQFLLGTKATEAV